MTARSPRQPSDGVAFATDLELVRSCLRGDGRCQEILIQRLSGLPAMVRASQRRLGIALDAHEVDDASQDSFAALWSKLERYNGRRSLEAWAYGFAVLEVHKILDRRRARRVVDEVREGHRTTGDEESGADPDAIDQALDRIGPPGDEIVRLKHFSGLTFQEIARELGCPIKTTMTRYYRTLERLRALLDPSQAESIGGPRDE